MNLKGVSGKYVVIIPAFNEEKNIGRVITGIKQGGTQADILVINDGSKDNTVAVAKASGARVISLPFNMGYGAALQTGFKYALARGYDGIVQLDADGQHDPKDISVLLQELEKGEAEVIIGSRFLKAGAYKPSFVRHWGIVLFSRIASLLIKQKVTDATSGYQAISKKALRFYTDPGYPVDYPDADVIIMLHRKGFRIKEVPVTMYQKADGKSMHSGLKPFYYIFKMVLSIFVTLLRGGER